VYPSRGQIHEMYSSQNHSTTDRRGPLPWLSTSFQPPQQSFRGLQPAKERSILSTMGRTQRAAWTLARCGTCTSLRAPTGGQTSSRAWSRTAPTTLGQFAEVEVRVRSVPATSSTCSKLRYILKTGSRPQYERPMHLLTTATAPCH